MIWALHAGTPWQLLESLGRSRDYKGQSPETYPAAVHKIIGC